MAVRELLAVVNFYYEALHLARKGEDTNAPSTSYGFGSQVLRVFYMNRNMKKLRKFVKQIGG